MPAEPTPDQHRALFDDCWEIARALPTSGVLDRGRRPYRAIRFERKLESVRRDPAGLLSYITGMARRTSDGLEALVQYDRIDLSVEQRLILDEDKIYAPLFTAEDRAAAREKLADWGTQIEQLARDRAEQDRDQSAQGDARVAALRATLPVDLAELRTIAAAANEPEEMIAANQCILEQQPNDVVALNRLGRAFEAVGWDEAACVSFEKVLEIDPGNAIAKRRLQSLAAER
jgi:hypothetical protein